MSFDTNDSNKQIPEPLSPDDIPLLDGESSFMKEKTNKRKSSAKNKSSRSKKIKTNYEYLSENDTGSDSSIDDYEKNILYEMENGKPLISPSNVAPFEFATILEGERFAHERGLPVLKPALPPAVNERLYGPHPFALDPSNKINRFFNSIQLKYSESEDCYYVEWEGTNVFAPTPILSYKRIYVIDYYFHIVGDIMNSSNKSFIISGPTGVGKTQIILFIIAFIRTLPVEIRPAIYIKNNKYVFTLYIENEVFVVPREENVRAVIEIVDSVSIYNKMLPPFGKRIEITNGNTLISSLNDSVVYYLPRWSKDEIKKCLKIISTPPTTPSLEWNDSISNTYERIGGIVKYIITVTTLNYDIDKEINESIETCKKNNIPVYYSWNNNNNNLMVQYADKTGLMYEDMVDEYYHISGRCIYSDYTIYLSKNIAVKDFYNIFRRFIKLQNWKEMLLLLIGFRAIHNNVDITSSIRFEYHNKNELFDSELPSWLIDTITKDDNLPDMVFYSHCMVFNFNVDNQTYSLLYLYPDGIISSMTFTSYDVIYYPSSDLTDAFSKSSELKKDVKLIKYDYDKILEAFPYLITPFTVLNEDNIITERQNDNLRSLPTVESSSIGEEINNNNNPNTNITFYLLSPSLVKTTNQTMESLVLIESSAYYSYFDMIINNSEWQQALFNLCRIIYLSPFIELKLVLYYYLYKKGNAYLIALHCNNETGYIKAIYDTFGEAKSFISSFTAKIDSLRNIFPSLPKVSLIENLNQNDNFFNHME